MPFFNTDHRFHYVETSGEGTPILMIHSTGVGSWQWKAYFALLCARPCMAIDLLGYHPSGAFSSTDSIHEDLEALEVLWGQFGIHGARFGAILVSVRHLWDPPRFFSTFCGPNL